LPVVGAIAPPAEVSHRLPDPEIGASLTTKKGFRAGTSRVRARSAPTDGDGVGVRQLRSVVRKVATCPRRALRDENRRARGDPLRRRLREPDTHATDLWRFMSTSRHRSRALQVLERATLREEQTRLPRAQVLPTSVLGMRGS